MVIEVAEQTKHAKAIEYAINTETMMQITYRRVNNTNDKLEHLKLRHLLLPLRPLGGIKG